MLLENIQINEYNNWESKEKWRDIMEYLTTNEMSKKWNISARRVAKFCEQNRVKGAIKKGKTWLVPYDAEKPSDPRKKK